MSEDNSKSKQGPIKNRDFEKEYNELFPESPCKPIQEWIREGDILIQFTLLEETPTYSTADTIIYQ